MLRLRSYGRVSVQNRRFRSNGGRLAQNFRSKGSPSTNHSSKKTKHALSYGIKIWTDLSSVLSQSTRMTDGQTDRQTDRQTPFSSLVRAVTPFSAERNITYARGTRFITYKSVACVTVSRAFSWLFTTL